MSQKVIFLNGPPRCGKDTAAHAMLTAVPQLNTCIAKMTGPMNSALSHFLGLIENSPLWQELRETDKDKPRDELFGTTMRKAFISFSEDFAKPTFGPAVFGHLMARSIAHSSHHLIIISDSGFAAETIPVINTVGPDNCLLIRIHRPGYGFKNDSRSYLDLNIKTTDLNNNGGLESFQIAAQRCLLKWL